MKKIITIFSLFAISSNLSFAHLSPDDSPKDASGKPTIIIEDLKDSEKALLKELSPLIKEKNTIYVDKTGKISFNGTEVSYSLLDALLDEVSEKDSSIYLKGDPDVQYKHMNAVVDLILLLKIKLSSIE